MFKTLRFRLTAVFSILIILAIVAVDTIVIKSYEDSKIEAEEVKLFTFANIVSDIYKGNIQDEINLMLQLKEYSQNLNSRILVLNEDREVFADSYNEFKGRKLDGAEVESAMNLKPLSNIYRLEGKPVLQLAIPVSENAGSEYRPIGAVLISSSLEGVYREMGSLKWTVASVSIGIIALSMVLIFFVSGTISRPIFNLTRASAKIRRGRYGEIVNIKRKDEIGRLIETFNEMSKTLYVVESNRKKFISDVSHELKTPLASIKALIESLTLYENNDVGIYRECLKDINTELDRLSNLVKSLLTTVRFGEEKIVPRKENLKDIVGEVVKLMSPYAAKNNVKLVNNTEADCMVSCDRDKIKEVLINLIDNGIKYGDDNKPSKCVEVGLDIDRKVFALNVRDNGKGMDENEIPYVFENFYRIDRARDGNIRGFGLGLSIVRYILDKHSWTISVRSQAGEGSVFSIYGTTL